ncbi:MAG: L-threonine 3-dehydrogenase [Novosphingobium sp.]|nr:L-threonine 3-dehydrogenase [Novosphingobium sp.]
MIASALWTTGPGRAELRPADLGALAQGDVRVRAIVSGISRGTERLVYEGRVPRSEWQRMRCPFQEGAFPWPVKYGYAMVGRVEAGAEELAGKRVFGLFPHQDRFDLPAAAAVPVPDAIPSHRAVLAPQMETALNAIWDAEQVEGRVAVVGGGVIGLLTAWLAARVADVVVIDRNPAREAVARELGLAFASPEAAAGECDLVFHASGTAAGLNQALELCRFEGRVIELSWFGDAPVGVMLGGAFHSRRLTLKASQVGSVAPARRGTHTHRSRLEEALALCAAPQLDVLVRDFTDFTNLPPHLETILSNPETLCHLIRYPE